MTSKKDARMKEKSPGIFFLSACMDVINSVNPYGKNVRKDRRQKDV